MFFLVFICLFLVISCIIKPSSRLITSLCFILIWVLWGWNYLNGDFIAYEQNYLNISKGFFKDANNFEFGYILLAKFFSSLGLSFSQYLILVSGIVLLIIYIFINKFSAQPALFSLIYFFFFSMEYVYLRNYISNSIIYLALIVYLNKKNNYKLKYTILILIATTFHISAIIFLFSLFFADIIKKKDIHLILEVAPFIATFLILIAPLVRIFLSNHISYKLNYYISTTGPTTVFYAHTTIIYLMYFYMKNLNKEEKGEIEKNKLITEITKINTGTLVYICLYYYVPTFSRILKLLLPLNILFIMNYEALFPSLKNKKKIIRFSILIIILVISLVFFLKSTLSRTIFPLFFFNKIFKIGEYIMPGI